MKRLNEGIEIGKLCALTSNLVTYLVVMIPMLASYNIFYAETNGNPSTDNGTKHHFIIIIQLQI
jgi:hypothetical protein